MDERQGQLDSLSRKQNLIRDRITQLVEGEHTGLYLYGRAGTGKTHLVRSWLDEIAPDDRTHFVDGGYMTGQALFQTLSEHRNEIIVLDDVSSLFADARAKQYLLAAMGRQGRADGGRTVHYRRHDGEEEVYFSGSIIAISNLCLTTDPRHQALASRACPVFYDPTDDEVAALMMEVMKDGWESPRGGTLDAAECIEVAQHVVDEARLSGKRPDMRVLIDHALADYLSSKNRTLLTHWKDLVAAAVQQGIPEFHHTDRKSRAEQNAELQTTIMALARDAAAATEEQKVAEFARQTGKSRRTYYRQKKAAMETAGPDVFPRLAR